MWTESNATRTDPNDTTCRRRVASLASADERGAPPVRLCPEKHHPLRNADVSLRCSLPSQAAVVGATTVLMASPAFAATIKLGGDNGELGFYVSALSADRPAAARASVRGRSTGIAPIPGATLHTTHSWGLSAVTRQLRVVSRGSGSVETRVETPSRRCFSRGGFFFSSSPKTPNSPLSPPLFARQSNKITVAKGETIEFVNNKAFPHNVVFDEDNVPSGVNADAISHEDYLNGPGEKVTNKFDTPGTYGYYCEPHQGAGMQGTIIVQ